MIGYTSHFYLIRCITNLHVGSGDANYGVIDKLVQRDPITNYPVIHSSAMKGAIREYFDKAIFPIESDIKKAFFRYIFGSEKKSRRENMKQGEFKFMQANLLSIPVRSNHRPFFRMISSSILQELNQRSRELSCSLNLEREIEILSKIPSSPAIFESAQEVLIEDYICNSITEYISPGIDQVLVNLKMIVGENMAVCNDLKHMESFTKKLPIIARNYLENGQSENLWYEEVVPRETRFTFSISYPIGKEGEDFFNLFDQNLNNQIIQIGANASIGYGCCQISRISN